MTPRGGGHAPAPVPALAEEHPPQACPSAPAVAGNLLLGCLGPDGRIKNLRSRIAVDAGFLDSARQVGPPEGRMRFSGACKTSGCAQWASGRCGVIDRVVKLAGTAEPPTSLPPCTIRNECRWFSQIGPGACGVCPDVITDTRAMAAS